MTDNENTPFTSYDEDNSTDIKHPAQTESIQSELTNEIEIEIRDNISDALDALDASETEKSMSDKRKLSKRGVGLVVSAVLIICLALACVAIPKLLPSDSDKSSSSGVSSTVSYGDPATVTDEKTLVKLLELKDVSDVQQLSVKNGNGEYSLDKTDKIDSDGNPVFYCNKVEKLFQDTKTVYDTISNLLTFNGTYIGEIAGNEEKYGFNAESPMLTITYTGGSLTLYRGDSTAGDAGYYVRNAALDKVYLIVGTYIDTIFDSNALDYVSLTITGGNTDAEGNERLIDLYYADGSKLEKPLYIKRNVDYSTLPDDATQEQQILAKSSLLMVSPYKGEFDSTLTTGYVTSAVFSIVAQSAYSIHASDKELKALGLDKSNPKIHAKVVVDGSEMNYYVGNLNKDKTAYYFMVDGVDIVFMVSTDTLQLFSQDYYKLIRSLVIMTDIDELSSLKLEFDGESYEFLLSGTDKELVARYNGSVLTTDYFRSLYSLVLATKREYPIENKSYGKELVKITFSYRDQSKANDVLTYYQCDTRRIAAYLNGDVQCEMRLAYIDKIKNAARNMSKNTEVDSDY